MTPEEARRRKHEEIAKQIEREDGLINIRTTWLLLSETVLFGAVGVLATKAADIEVGNKPHVGLVYLLLFGAVYLLLIAALIAHRCRGAIRAANEQLCYLRKEWTNLKLLETDYIRPFGGVDQHDQGIGYPIQLATVFLAFSILGAGVCAGLAVLALGSKDVLVQGGFIFVMVIVFAVATIPPWKASDLRRLCSRNSQGRET